MKKLMRNVIFIGIVDVIVFVVLQLLHMHRGRRVFHGAAHKISHHHLTVFVPRIFYSGVLAEKLNHFRRVAKNHFRIVFELGLNQIFDGQGLFFSQVRVDGPRQGIFYADPVSYRQHR